MDWLESLTLGAVQGLTEFLPVSSDGHLAVTQQTFARLRGFSRPAAEDVFVDVMLHLGTLVAILLHYRQALWLSLRGLAGSAEIPTPFRRDNLVRVGWLACVATLPLVPDALFLKKFIDQAFQSPTLTGFGFLVTATILLLTLRMRGGEKGPFETTWVDALLVGLAQACAPLPGVSRSGLTIASALALGFSRTWAVGFSLLIAVPAILGAVVFELRKVDTSILSSTRVTQIALAMILAGLVGYAAIVWLVRIVRAGRLWYFSVYLIVLAGVVLATAKPVVSGGGPDDRNVPTVDRPDRGEPDGASDPATIPRHGSRGMDRSNTGGPRSDRTGVGPPWS
jgi:undecaprenyl-diphosphatase